MVLQADLEQSSSSAMHPARQSFLTNDGVAFSWLEAGHGQLLLTMPGGHRQRPFFAISRNQLKGLGDKFNSDALDHRGHGDSDNKPAHRDRITRLAGSQEVD